MCPVPPVSHTQVLSLVDGMELQQLMELRPPLDQLDLAPLANLLLISLQSTLQSRCQAIPLSLASQLILPLLLSVGFRPNQPHALRNHQPILRHLLCTRTELYLPFPVQQPEVQEDWLAHQAPYTLLPIL